jgi:hypothetical protein
MNTVSPATGGEMSPKGEQAAGSPLGELLSLETSVLRALCLSINTPGSVLKDKILDALSESAFYVPINKALFSVLTELHQRGEYVVCSNLRDELGNRQVNMPEGFHLEDLFRGDLPKLPEVAGWLSRLKDRAGKAQPPAAGAGAEVQTAAGVGSQVAPVASAKPEAPASPAVRRGIPELERPGRARQVRTEAAEGKARPAVLPQLASEGEEWGKYLQGVVAKQGKIFETGFAALDERPGGLSPSLMLAVDQDGGRLSGFLKQLTDQVAARMKVPCLYLSFNLPKAALRVRTLARLSGVPARDIERGRIKKGSPEWECLERYGREAADWLRWVFVVDADPEMDLDHVKHLSRQFFESHGASTGLLVVDPIEKMNMRGESPQSLVAGLKATSESLEVLVIAAAATKALCSEPGVDFLASVSDATGTTVQLEVLPTVGSRSTIIHFEYRPDIHRFVERSAA